MKLTMTRYGLRKKGTAQLLTVEVRGVGENQFCNSYEAVLEAADDQFGTVYLANDRRTIEQVIQGDGIPWYNSGLSRPQLGNFKAEELEIVEVNLTWED